MKRQGGGSTDRTGGTLSRRFRVIPQMCLKPTDFRKHPETFEASPLECPPRVTSRRLPGCCATGVGHRAPRAAASRAPLLGSSMEASGLPSRSCSLRQAFLAWPTGFQNLRTLQNVPKLSKPVLECPARVISRAPGFCATGVGAWLRELRHPGENPTW